MNDNDMSACSAEEHIERHVREEIARAVEAEREACAALVDEEATGWAAPWDSHEVAILSRVAKAIRARGET